MYCTISILDDQNSISPDQISLLNLTYAQSKNLTFLFKNLLPAYLCTDISVNFTQESPVLQLPVEENRNSLSSTQPILCPSMSQKVVFAAKRLCTMVGTVKKTKTLFAISLLTGYRYRKNFNRVPGAKGRHVKKISKICDEK